MNLLKILEFPDSRLRQQAVAVNTVDESTHSLARDMLHTMYLSGGIGLAATQVNVLKRILVMDLSSEQNQPLCFIDPEITASSGTQRMREGCLSVPEFYADVERSEKIMLRARTLEDKIIEQECDGLLAVCVQHEIDHLDGKLFIDYLSPLKKRRLNKLLRQSQAAAKN